MHTLNLACPTQFYVRQGERVFRDEVVWDVGNPHNVAEPYAVRVCADLGLGADWFDAIRAHVQQQLQDVKQVGLCAECVERVCRESVLGGVELCSGVWTGVGWGGVSSVCVCVRASWPFVCVKVSLKHSQSPLPPVCLPICHCPSPPLHNTL